MALIMPSIIGLLIYSKLKKRDLTWFEFFSNLALFMVITNAICYGILIFIFERNSLLFSISFTMKYSILAMFIAVVIAVLYRIVELNIKMNVKVKVADEKNH
ncbi:hypothetical protein [Salinibacillus aidingensis]